MAETSEPKTLPGHVAPERYPGHHGGYEGSEPRELSERTPRERELIDQGHTIDNAMRLAAEEEREVAANR